MTITDILRRDLFIICGKCKNNRLKKFDLLCIIFDRIKLKVSKDIRIELYNSILIELMIWN